MQSNASCLPFLDREEQEAPFSRSGCMYMFPTDHRQNKRTDLPCRSAVSRRQAMGIFGMGLVGAPFVAQLAAVAANIERFQLRDWGGPRLDAALIRPASWTADRPVILALHGANRNAAAVEETWSALAEKYDFLAVVPRFDDVHFNGSRHYQLGSVGGATIPRNSAFRSILPLFAEVLRRSGARATGFRIFGHSAGAQFVHRLLMIIPNLPIERAVASMAGWYTLPTFDQAWPYGLRNSAATDSQLSLALEKRLLVFLGGRDTDFHDELLRKTSKAMEQGNTRLERGIRFYHLGQAAALKLRATFGWQLAIEPTLDHDGHGAANVVANWLANGDQEG